MVNSIVYIPWSPPTRSPGLEPPGIAGARPALLPLEGGTGAGDAGVGGIFSGFSGDLMDINGY